MCEGEPKQADSDPTAQPSAEPGSAATARVPDIAALQEQVEKQKEQSRYHLEQWKRAAADLQNYRKRVEKERGEWLQSGQAALVSQLLPVLDDLERAFLTLPVALHGFTWTEGLALIDRKLQVVLEHNGLKEIETLGRPFDPSRHQAILQEDTTEHADGQVLAVLQKGYILHDKVLRPAMVKVARNPQSREPAPTGGAAGSAETQPDGEAGQAGPQTDTTSI
jgi:molecular chaperone GrpE